MPFHAPLFLRLFAFLALLVSSVLAHEPFEITTAARIRATGLEMQVTMTRATAHAIAFDDQGEPQNFAPQRFAELQPFLLAEGSGGTYAETGRRLGLSEGAVKMAILRLRQRSRELFRAEIAATVVTEQDVEDEVRHLSAVLAG